MKQIDIDRLLMLLVADGEASRCALKVLTTWGHERFAEFFRSEVAAVLAKANRSDARERRLVELIEAARDRLLSLAPVAPASTH